MFFFFSFCPPGWKLFGNKCFLFKGEEGDVRTNWTAAQAFCREQEGNLAVIDSQYENGEQNSVRIPKNEALLADL